MTEASSSPGAAASLASSMSPRQLRVVLVAVMTGMFLGAIDGTIVATALPTIVGDLGGQSQAPWLGTGFLLAQTIGTPIIGNICLVVLPCPSSRECVHRW